MDCLLLEVCWLGCLTYHYPMRDVHCSQQVLQHFQPCACIRVSTISSQVYTPVDRSLPLAWSSNLSGMHAQAMRGQWQENGVRRHLCCPC